MHLSLWASNVRLFGDRMTDLVSWALNYYRSPCNSDRRRQGCNLGVPMILSAPHEYFDVLQRTHWHRPLLGAVLKLKVIYALSNSVLWTSAFVASACSTGDRNSGRNSASRQPSRMLLELCVLRVDQNRSQNTQEASGAAKCVDKGGGKSAVKCSHCLLLFLRGKFHRQRLHVTTAAAARNVCPIWNFCHFSLDSKFEWSVRNGY